MSRGAVAGTQSNTRKNIAVQCHTMDDMSSNTWSSTHRSIVHHIYSAMWKEENNKNIKDVASPLNVQLAARELSF